MYNVDIHNDVITIRMINYVKYFKYELLKRMVDFQM